ncbi:MAG: FAD-dependent oxidoreductase [Bdellovibrionales bacterium]|nr:FAD-dependent oxidoreductase [Bdellovibrionales bacterium]
MSTTPSTRGTVRIIGAGFSGLTVAYFCVRQGLQVEVIEQNSEVGGLIKSVRMPWGLVESAANGVLNSALFEEISAAIGIELVSSSPQSRKRYILREGRPRRWPLSLLESLGALWRFIVAGWTRGGRKPQAMESVGEWGTRVFGAPFARRMLGAALQGIYASDENSLSASLILSRFFRSGAPRTKSPKPKMYGTVAPREGLGSFLVALRGWLERQGVVFRLGEPVRRLELSTEVLTVVATSADQAATLVRPTHPELAGLLDQIEMVPIVSVAMAYPSSAAKLPGFGCLFPRSEGYEVLGILFNTSIFPHRGPLAGDGVTETWIFRRHDAILDRTSDEELLRLIRTERARFYGEDVAPLAFRITRWPRALPHYNLRLEQLLPKLALELERSGLWLHGNYLGALSLAKILERSRDLGSALAKEASK